MTAPAPASTTVSTFSGDDTGHQWHMESKTIDGRWVFMSCGPYTDQEHVERWIRGANVKDGHLRAGKHTGRYVYNQGYAD